MRITAINQFYSPDISATSQLLTQLCEDLAAQGDAVTVIAGRARYLGGGRLPARERIRGVDVVRPWATGFGKSSVVRRLSDYTSFWLSSIVSLAREQRPDVLLVLTTPPMIPAAAALVSQLRDVPLVTWVQDVYPEVAVAFGLLRERHPVVRLLRTLSEATHRSSRLSVVLSQGMAKRIVAQGQVPHRIRVVPNWSDGQAVRPLPHASNRFRKEHGLEERFVVMYSGNLGVGHEIESLVDAAGLLERRHPSVIFVFVGGGARLEEAKRLSAHLTNVLFLPYQLPERLSESLSAADVHLASLREGLAGLLVPSKLYGILAAGRPIMYLGPADCELSRVIAQQDLGWAGRPGDSQGLADALVAALENPAETAERGRRARQVFDEEYDRPVAVARWRAVLGEAVASS